MMQKTQKKVSFFDSIEKNLTLEAEETEQTDNEVNKADVSADKELDNQLASLKNGGDSNVQSDSSNSNSDSTSNSDNMSEGDNDSGEDSGSEDSEFNKTTDTGGSGEPDNVSSVGEDDATKHVDSVPRKLTLYVELTRIYNVVKEALDTLEQNPVENSNIKYCVAQLQSILIDTQFILQTFTDKSEKDCHVQIHLIKNRLSLVLELLSRQTKN